MVPTPADGRAGIDAALVRRLIAEQLPQWSDLPAGPVDIDGWDNRTYRLGDDMTVRLPTAVGYAAAVAKEKDWLPGRTADRAPVDDLARFAVGVAEFLRASNAAMPPVAHRRGRTVHTEGCRRPITTKRPADVWPR